MSSPAITGTCHCGAVSITLPEAPAEITHCNCSLCRRYGVLWAYYPIAGVTIATREPTETYAWGGKNVDFHRCAHCGTLTHWYPRRKDRRTLGINIRLFDPGVVTAASVLQKDAGGHGRFY